MDERQSLVRALNLVLDFKATAPAKPRDWQLRDRLSGVANCPIEARPLEEVLTAFESDYLPGAVNPGSQGFFSYPYNGTSPFGLMGELLTAVLQQNLVDCRYSPSATVMDFVVLSWLRQLAGYEAVPSPCTVFDFGGVVTASGTTSNAIAMLAARERAAGRGVQWAHGAAGGPIVLAPEQLSHYGIRAACKWLNLPQAYQSVPIISYRIDLQELGHLLSTLGPRVAMVVAFAGDSRTFTCERLDGIAKLTRRLAPEAWLHCDAAHGFPLLLSALRRGLLAGIEDFDSITMDGHKAFGLPFGCSALLLKETLSLELIASGSPQPGDYSLGLVTPFQSSRSWTSLKLWAHMLGRGQSGMASDLEDRFLLAGALAERVVALGCEVVRQGDLPSVFFRPSVDAKVESDRRKAFHERIIQRLIPDFDLVQMTLPRCGDAEPMDVLRLTIGHAGMSEVEQDRFGHQLSLAISQG